MNDDTAMDIVSNLERIATALERIQIAAIKETIAEPSVNEQLQARADYLRKNWEDFFSDRLIERNGKLYDDDGDQCVITPYGYRKQKELDMSI